MKKKSNEKEILWAKQEGEFVLYCDDEGVKHRILGQFVSNDEKTITVRDKKTLQETTYNVYGIPVPKEKEKNCKDKTKKM